MVRSRRRGTQQHPFDKLLPVPAIGHLVEIGPGQRPTARKRRHSCHRASRLSDRATPHEFAATQPTLPPRSTGPYVTMLASFVLPVQDTAMEPQHWLYPVDPARQDRFLDDWDTGESVPVTAEHLWEQVERFPARRDMWVLTSGFRQMRPGDLVWIYVGGARGQLVATAIAESVLRRRSSWEVILSWDGAKTRRLRSDPITRAEIGQAPQSVRRASVEGRSVIEAWLARAELQVANPDPEPLSDEDARERVVRAIVQRRGQRAFRERLLEAYDGACAITGTTAPDVLEAAHIRRYMGPQSNVITNGLLL